VVLVTRRVSVGFVTASAVFSSSGIQYPGLHVMTLKLVNEFI